MQFVIPVTCKCLCVWERESEWMCERVRNSLFVSALSVCVCERASATDCCLAKQKKHLIVLETTITIMFTFDWNDFKWTWK